MNKKGFSLVELLAVIIILSVIVLVAVPTFNKYVLNVDNQYYKNLEKTVKTAGMEYFAENIMFLPSKIGNYSTVHKESLLASGIIEDITDSKGVNCRRAEVIVKKNDIDRYEYEACLECGNYKTNTPICNGEYDDWSDNNGDDDKTVPDVAEIYVQTKTTKSITVNATCIDKESSISKYIYYMKNEEGIETKNESSQNSYKFENLVVDKKYNFRVECVNKAGLKKESNEVDALTPKFTNPIITSVPTANGYPLSGYAYSPERATKITYNQNNIESDAAQFFLRSTVTFTVPSNVSLYKCSGDLSGLNQNSCHTSTRQIEKNTWYKTNDINTITTFATDTNPSSHTIYAQIGDGYNLSGVINRQITNIDTTQPTIVSLSDPLTLNKDPYSFRNNVSASFGFSGGSVGCSPGVSRGTGSYNVTCTAVGNNGLVDSVSFEVKHSYPAKKNPKTCESCTCNKQSFCYESSGLATSPCSGSDCLCCTDQTCTKYDCSTYSCPDGGKLKGQTCYY